MLGGGLTSGILTDPGREAVVTLLFFFFYSAVSLRSTVVPPLRPLRATTGPIHMKGVVLQFPAVAPSFSRLVAVPEIGPSPIMVAYPAVE